MKIMIVPALALALGGCETAKEFADKIDTPENRIKGAEALVTAASGSCEAAVGYLRYVGPDIEGYDGFVAELREECVRAQELELAPVEAPEPVPAPEPAA